MKFINRFVLISLVLFICMIRSAEAKEYTYSEHLPASVCIFGGMYFPPLQYNDKTGYFFDDIRTLCHAAGIDFSIIVRPTKRLFREMRQGKIDAWLGFKGGLFPWLRDPQNGVDCIDVTSHEYAFKMLADGRVTYVVDYREPAMEVLKHVTINNIKTFNLVEVPLRIGIMKHKKGYTLLSRKIDEAFIKNFYQLKTTQTMIRINVWDKPDIIFSDLKNKYTQKYGIAPDL